MTNAETRGFKYRYGEWAHKYKVEACIKYRYGYLLACFETKP